MQRFPQFSLFFSVCSEISRSNIVHLPTSQLNKIDLPTVQMPSKIDIAGRLQLSNLKK